MPNHYIIFEVHVNWLYALSLRVSQGRYYQSLNIEFHLLL